MLGGSERIVPLNPLLLFGGHDDLPGRDGNERDPESKYVERSRVYTFSLC